MLISNIILSALVLCYIENVCGKMCNDCVAFQLCPAAAELAVNHKNEVTKSKFIESFCGYEYLKLKRVPKVCCFDFTLSAGNIKTTDTKDAVETHPNVKLLPESCGDILGHRIFGGRIAKLYEFPWMALISYKTQDFLAILHSPQISSIIGGRIAKLYEFPWMALISYKTRNDLQFLCGGSIISSKYILTAGHCVGGNKVIAGVRIGEFDLENKNDCQGEGKTRVCEINIQDIRVENIIQHPNYSGLPSPQNDIALLRLKKPIDFTHKNALPICLPVTQKLRNVQVGNQVATITGWGLTETAKYSPVLLKVNITIMTSEKCRSFYNGGDNERNIKELCAGEYNKDSCNGDSGGPMMLEGDYNGANRYIQYGIVSHGPRQCGSGVPGIYTDVTKYMDWILDSMRE